MPDKAKTILWQIARPIGTVVVALLIGVLLILPTGTSPLDAYGELWNGAFGSTVNLLNTLSRSTPFLFTGLAAAFAFKAGVFNIGIEGQLYMGAFFAAMMGIYGAALPKIILIPLCLAAAMVGGMLWAVVPGLLNTRYKINLVVISIMMNNIAQLFTAYLAGYPFKGELPIGATFKVGENAMLPRFHGRSELNLGFVIAVALAVLLFFVVFRTKFGYEMRALGLNRRFTRYMGVHLDRKTLAVLFISAAIAGLAGSEQVIGVNYRFLSDFSDGYGFTGITVALLGNLNPLGVIVGALLFGALNNGAIQMEVMTNISRDLISALQAVIILLLAAREFVLWKKSKKPKQEKKEAQA